MKHTLVLLLLIMPFVANAQDPKEYKVNDQQRGKVFSKTHYSASDSITIPDKQTEFKLQKKGGLNVPINNNGTKKSFSGTYIVSQLYEDALRNSKPENVIMYGHVGKALTRKLKSNDSTCIAFMKKLNAVGRSEKEQIIEYDNPICLIKGNTITISNPGDNCLYVDVIWFQDNECRSVISYSADYCSTSLIKGESVTYTIDERLMNKHLYITCTPLPVAYNTLTLSDIAEPSDFSLEVDVPITIIPLKE